MNCIDPARINLNSVVTNEPLNGAEMLSTDLKDEDEAQGQQLRNILVQNDFNNVTLIKEHGEAKIFECSKGTDLYAVKMAPWTRIEPDIDALTQLQGQGVVHLYMSGQIENSTLGYIVLEWLYPLPTRINTLQELQRITTGIMSALARIHKQDYLHRDIKFSNIMIDKNNDIKLIDFECAMKEDAEKFNVFFGTDFYKPPELSERYCFRCVDMRRAKVYGSVKSDSYSAALVCASLMYDTPLDSREDIQTMIDWLEQGKLSHLATSSAVELFKWLLASDPLIRFSATQALNHPFLMSVVNNTDKRRLCSNNIPEEGLGGSNVTQIEIIATSRKEQVHIKQFFDHLVANGFSNIHLIKEDERLKIFECQKGTGLGIIKIGPLASIEREAAILKAVRGSGVARLYMSGQIENSTSGYMILERLDPLPKRIKSLQELKDITMDVMNTLVRIHKKQYIHRNISPSTIMMSRNNHRTATLTCFEWAVKIDAEGFGVPNTTDLYKAPELCNIDTTQCITTDEKLTAKLHGSVKSDSYSAALVCASLMYDTPLDSREDIRTMIDWLEQGKLSHLATSSAVELFKWLLASDPSIRFSATQALNHPFMKGTIVH